MSSGIKGNCLKGLWYYNIWRRRKNKIGFFWTTAGFSHGWGQTCGPHCRSAHHGLEPPLIPRTETFWRNELSISFWCIFNSVNGAKQFSVLAQSKPRCHFLLSPQQDTWSVSVGALQVDQYSLASAASVPLWYLGQHCDFRLRHHSPGNTDSSVCIRLGLGQTGSDRCVCESRSLPEYQTMSALYCFHLGFVIPGGSKYLLWPKPSGANTGILDSRSPKEVIIMCFSFFYFSGEMSESDKKNSRNFWTFDVL